MIVPGTEDFLELPQSFFHYVLWQSGGQETILWEKGGEEVVLKVDGWVGPKGLVIV